MFSPLKSPLAAAKVNSKRLHSCASCQLLLTMFRYCSFVGISDDFEQLTWQCGQRLRNKKLRKKALAVLLDHWQTVICAYKDVALFDLSVAHQYKSERFDAIQERVEQVGPVRITVDDDSFEYNENELKNRKSTEWPQEETDTVADRQKLSQRKMSDVSKRSSISSSRYRSGEITRRRPGSLSSSPRSTLIR